MATKTVHVEFSDTRHAELSEQKGEATWREAIEAGCEVLADE